MEKELRVEDTQGLEDAQALAEELNLPFDALESLVLDTQTLSLLPVDWMLRHSCLPLGLEGNQVRLAFAERDILDHVEELELLAGRRISLVVSPKARIEEIMSLSRPLND